MMEFQATTLWNAHAESADEDARARIIEENLALVRHVARGIHARVGPYVPFEDVVQAGYVGLIRAVDSFDPSRGLAFSTYAVPRIRGAIIDELRRSDMASRSVRRRQRMIADAEHRKGSSLDRRPTSRETANDLDIDVETLWKWKADVRGATQISLDSPVAASSGVGLLVSDVLPGCTGLEVEERLTIEREVAALATEIARLTDRERTVLTLYYYEELKLREIGEALGLTESRISQIRTRALDKLRARMARLREDA